MHVIIINSDINKTKLKQKEKNPFCSGLQFFKQFGCRDRLLEVGYGALEAGGGGALFISCGQTPDTRDSCRTGVVHGRRAPRQEWSIRGEHQDRSGPWEESIKTGVVHGRRAPRQEWSMGGEHQDSSGPWEDSTKTGVVHGRRAPRQSYRRQTGTGSTSRLLLLV